jgi:hypothetical protein
VHFLNSIIITLFLIINCLYSSYYRLIIMGNYLSCLSVDGNMDAATPGHMRNRKRNDANYFRYSEEHRFHNEKNCPYPLPNDLTEIDR